MKKQFIPLKEALQEIGISRSTFYSYRNKGIIREAIYINPISRRLYFTQDIINRLKKILNPIPIKEVQTLINQHIRGLKQK